MAMETSQVILVDQAQDVGVVFTRDTGNTWRRETWEAWSDRRWLLRVEAISSAQLQVELQVAWRNLG